KVSPGNRQMWNSCWIRGGYSGRNIRQRFDRLCCFLLMKLPRDGGLLRRNVPITSARAKYENGRATPGRLSHGNHVTMSKRYFAAATLKPWAAEPDYPTACADSRSRRRARCPSECRQSPSRCPGCNPSGFLINGLGSSWVQVPPLAFMAAEKLNPPRPSPLLSPTMP